MVATQRSLQTLDNPGSNPVVDNFFYKRLLFKVYRKKRLKERPTMAHYCKTRERLGTKEQALRL